MKTYAVFDIFKYHAAALCTLVGGVKFGRIIFLYLLCGDVYLVLNFVSAYVGEYYRVADHDLINNIAYRGFPVNAFQKSLKSTRRRDIITHAFHFHFRPSEAGIIALNDN